MHFRESIVLSLLGGRFLFLFFSFHHLHSCAKLEDLRRAFNAQPSLFAYIYVYNLARLGLTSRWFIYLVSNLISLFCRLYQEIHKNNPVLHFVYEAFASHYRNSLMSRKHFDRTSLFTPFCFLLYFSL